MPDIFVSSDSEEKKQSEEKPEEKQKLDVKVVDKDQGIKSEDKEIDTTPKGGSFSAFIKYPETIHFDTQEDKEQIILFLRKHWVTNIPWLFLTFILIIAPSIIFPAFISHNLLSSIPARFLFVGSLIWYLVTFGFAMINFITWYFNVYIVTNERVVDVDFYQLLYKQMSSARISRVQDLTYKLNGVVRAIFDFGDVFIETAGEEPNFDFEAVPHPEQVVRILSNLTEHQEQPV